MPNHRKLAREFTLFDNGYVSGTNSADGHAWSTQAWPTTTSSTSTSATRGPTPTTATDAMALSTGGALWDAALKKGKTLRVYGEFCDEELATDRARAEGLVRGLGGPGQAGRTSSSSRPTPTSPASSRYINPEVHYWPLLQSDQSRADVFIKEYEQFSRTDKVPT